MKIAKLSKISAVAAACCFALVSCNQKKEESVTQEPFVRNKSDENLEDAQGQAAYDDQSKEIPKDSATVGPVAPKSPPHGGRSEQ